MRIPYTRGFVSFPEVITSYSVVSPPVFYNSTVSNVTLHLIDESQREKLEPPADEKVPKSC